MIRVKAHTRVSPRRKRPATRAREDALRKALIVALRGLPESVIVDVLTDQWTTLHRLDLLKERFP